VTPDRNSSPRLRTTCEKMPLVLKLGRRWVDEVVHPSTIAERPQVAITDGHTASLVVGVSATPRPTRTAGSSATMPERSSGSLVRTTQRAEPCRSSYRDARSCRDPRPRCEPRRVRRAGRGEGGSADQSVGGAPNPEKTSKALPQASSVTSASGPLSSQPGRTTVYGGRSQRRNRLLRRFQASAWPPSLYAWSRWVMKNVVISTTRGRRSPNAQEVHDPAVVDPLEGVRAGAAVGAMHEDHAVDTLDGSTEGCRARSGRRRRSRRRRGRTPRASTAKDPTSRRRSTAPGFRQHQPGGSSHTLSGRRGT